MKYSLKDKAVWITGASSGIGRALAIELAHKGAKCILTARSLSGLEETLSLMKNREKHRLLPLDLTNYEAVDEKAEELLRNQQVDILINNAGISQRSRVMETSFSVYRNLMEVNYFAVVYLTKLVTKQFISNKSGMVVTISSIAGKVGPPMRSGYAASKHAQHGFFDTYRAETEKEGIHTMMVCPGYINTPLPHNALAADGSKYNQEDPENAGGMEPEELAKKVVSAIESKKYDVAYGGFEVNALRLKKFWPSLLRRLLAKKANPK